jgi:hypothetical protein
MVMARRKKLKLPKFLNLPTSTLSLGAFLLVNYWCQANALIPSVQPTKLPVKHNWQWWRSNEYTAQTKNPDVVLMGSSLIMIPITLVEADHSNKQIDSVKHYRSTCLEDGLANTSSQPHKTSVTVFNFALPGSMVSDQYMVASSLFKDKQKPKLLVLGLTLRDFVDSGVECAASTPTYQFFKHYFEDKAQDDLSLVALQTSKIWQGVTEKAQDWMDRNLYLSGKRLAAQYLNNAFWQEKISGVTHGKEKLDDNLVVAPSKDMMDSLFGDAVEPGQFLFTPYATAPYQDNTREYRRRFKDYDPAKLAIQEEFLSKLMAHCKAQNIEVMIVNMPLTPQNMALMPDGSYEKYLASTSSLAQANGCRFVDLNNGNFGLENFKDTAHMNSAGGKKLVESIVGSIKNDRALAQMIVPNSKLAGSNTSVK